MKNNKGLSLVELIVAFAIIAIAGTAIYGLMSAGTNHFNNTGKDVGLQYEQQVVVNRLKDALIEASSAISYDDSDSEKPLYVYSVKDMGVTGSGAVAHTYKYEITKIYHSGTNLMYKSGLFDTLDASNLNSVEGSLLGENVKDISFSLAEISDAKISFEIIFENSGKEIKSTQIVSLRNAIKNVTPSGDVEFVSEDSFYDRIIQYVTIYRGSHAFTQNETTEVGLLGAEVITVQFDYKVTATETSRTYAAYWEIDPTTAVSGVSVNPATGVFTVDPHDLPSTYVTSDITVRLRCTSIDNPAKSQSIYVKITNGGVYPTGVRILTGGEVKKAGYTDFYIYPEVTYTSGLPKNDGDLCLWSIDKKLPVGSFFKLDPDTHKYTFRATTAMNGETYKFIATVKEPKSDGTKAISAPLEFTVQGVKSADEFNEMKLDKQDDIYNKRGSFSTIMAAWKQNNTVSDYTYYWKIESVGANWGATGDDRSNFDKMISIYNESNYSKQSNGYYKANAGISLFRVAAKTELDWTRDYTIKVLCYAEDSRGNKYGSGNEVDGTYDGPVETEISFRPVKIILKPITAYNRNTNENFSFVSGNEIRRAVKAQKQANQYVNDDNPYFNDNALRSASARAFTVEATGIVTYDNGNKVFSISSPSTGNSESLTQNTVFSFYNNKGDSKAVPKNVEYTTGKGNKKKTYKYNLMDYYGQQAVDWNNVLVIYAKLNDNKYKDLYDRYDTNQGTLIKANRPRYMTIRFNASDGKGNSDEVYILNGNNIYSDSDLTRSSEYWWTIKYDSKELQNENYVEIRP